MIENGAKVKSKDTLNRTPLHYACSLYRNEKIAEVLIEKGASINSWDNDGGTPLH